MDLLTTIGACSVAKDFTLLFAMVITFSQGRVFTVQDAAELVDPPVYDPDAGVIYDEAVEARRPRSRAEAAAQLTHLRDVGAAPVMGLLPVPPAWAQLFQRGELELLDPCVNISIASAMVSRFEYECGANAERQCVLRRYAELAGVAGFDEMVLETIETHDMPVEREVAPETDGALNAPIHAQSSERDWGADKIFFRTIVRRTGNADQRKRGQPKRGNAAAMQRPQKQ